VNIDQELEDRIERSESGGWQLVHADERPTSAEARFVRQS
jgi:hypothetical protein